MHRLRGTRSWRVWLLGFVLVGLLSVGARAGVISAVATAELVEDGPYAGWYRYTYEVTWDFDKGLSHLDIVLELACVESEHEYGFDTGVGLPKDGHSTGADWRQGDRLDFTVPFEGFFEARGDPSVSLADALIKWEPVEADGEPGSTGVGEFWFYANIAPGSEYATDVVVAKHSPGNTYGDLTGDYPVPEPLTAAMIGAGLALALYLRRK